MDLKFEFFKIKVKKSPTYLHSSCQEWTNDQLTGISQTCVLLIDFPTAAILAFQSQG